MMRPKVAHAAATARREGLLVRVREARPEDAAQMGYVFVNSYVAANRGIVSAADLAGRSYAQSGAAWLRSMREIAAARATGRAALPLEEIRTAETVFFVAESWATDGTNGTEAAAAGAIAGVAVTGPAVLACLEHTVPPRWLRDAGEVSALYVAPGRQRRGVGRGLLRAAAQYHARAGRERLIVGALAAADAVGFYAAMGGRLIGRCAYPDEDGMALDGVVFGWLLPPKRRDGRRDG
jgi:GNAT superfamily N-acetyltransferase